ncbi:MAG: hypothetical protein LBH93_06920 [Chitinispirillales bacterium]|jgi:hypothetical protein|nr:hypothetical protein [Chitinispirillales bacterium]
MLADLNDKQNEALAYFESNRDDWVKNPLFKNKYAIIRENALAGIFDTFEAAITEAVQKYPEIDFIVQEIVSDSEVVNFYYPALV